jgi:hypothetical protein
MSALCGEGWTRWGSKRFVLSLPTGEDACEPRLMRSPKMGQSQSKQSLLVAPRTPVE